MNFPYQNPNFAAILPQYCCNMNLLPKPAYSESCNIAASGNIAAILQLLPERAYTERCIIAASGNIAAILHLRAVAAYLKVVRRRKSPITDDTRGGEHERGTPPLVMGLGVSTEKILNFQRFYVRF